MEDEEKFEEKNLDNQLYRITPSNKTTILAALKIYSQLPLNINKANVEQILRDLETPIQVNSETNIEIKTTMQNETLKNKLQVLKRAMNETKEKTANPENKKLIERLIEMIPEVV